MSLLNRAGALAAGVVALLAVSTGAAHADPPYRPDVLTGTQLSTTTLVPGQKVHVNWKFNTAFASQVTAVQLWLAHSTGMGHAPNTLVKAGVDPNVNATDFTVPTVTPSGHGNIWIFDVVWVDNGQPTELSLTDVTVR